MNIRELKKEIKGIFIPPKKVYYYGKIKYGTPYFWPINFSNSVIKIRKLELNTKETPATSKFRKHKKFNNVPMIRRTKYWIVKLFSKYYYIEIGWPIKMKKTNLGWKDKWDSPRYEWPPSFQIFFFNWQFCIWWIAPDENNDSYYEMILWYLFYSNPNESAWNKKYLI